MIPFGSITYWKRYPVGGLVKVDDFDQADVAVLSLPTLPGGSATFEFAADRLLLEGFLLGLSHGVTLGRQDMKNEQRKLLGFEASHDFPPMQGVRNASRK